jgi:adenylyl cyclase-associated protein
MSDASQFYANRVLKEFKDKDPTHVEWVKQWMKIFNELHAYVKQYHTTGLTWGTHGQQDSGSIAVAAPPPPPPPPPPPSSSLSSAAQMDDGQSRTELMNSINALGAGVTSHLKKVPDELKIHKNPQLRDQSANQPIERSNVSNNSQVCFIFYLESCNKNSSLAFFSFQTTTSNTSSKLTSGSPKLALEGNKWVVEFHSGRSDLKITETNMKHTIYVYKCSNSTLTVQGKVNSIILDQCTKVGIQFTSVVSLVEFINCRGMKVQVLDHVPTIQIEKTDGCHVYLSKTSLDTEFITSKSSEMTVNVPFGDGEYKEHPIPEQFKTHLKGGKQLVTVPNESAGV